jgi:ankyrin repeat protein
VIRKSWSSKSCLKERTECEIIIPCDLIGPLIFFTLRFRWVFCQLEVLRHCLPGSIRQTLEQLPESLDDTYLRVLRQIPQANQAQAHCMLQCLVVAVRPLSVAELAELLAFDFDAAQGGIPKYRPTLRMDDQTQAVLSTCSSLVTIIDERRSGHQVVQFSHFSVKEFLVSIRLSSSLGDISRYHIRLGSAHTILTQACLGLLLYSDDDITKVEHFPLAGYAAEHWVQHAQFEDVASRVKDGMEILFKSDKPHFKAWVRIYDIDPWEDYSFAWEEDEYASPLYYSVLCGFYDLVDHLASEHSGYVNKFGGEYRFPLLAALGQGHIGVAELLLKHGADVNVSLLEVLEGVAYRYDLWDNLLEIVKFLLKHGADVNARDDTFTSPLHWAAANLNKKEAMILLNHKADVNSQNKDGKTPMHMLLENDIYDDIYDDDHDHDYVRLLLEHGAKVNIRDTDNRTPFLLALDANRFSAALIFLEHGAHFNAQELNRRDKHNYTLLHWAILVRNFKLPRILLENGADANAKNDHGQTPLHVMSESDIKDGGNILNLVLLLLKHDAAANSRDMNNETPLHLAIERNRFKLAEILLEHGADVDAENIDGQTPLHTLSESDSIKDGDDILSLVLLLLKHGAAVNNADANSETPLHLAIERNRFKLAEILLEHGADANVENINGHTPLHTLSKIDSIKDEADILNLVLLLLKYGAAANNQNVNNETPLHLAVEQKWLKLTEILLEHGADADAKNINGQTPLHTLSESDGIEDGGDVLNLALVLLEHSAAANSQDMNDETPLHLAIEQNRFKLAEILLEHGADADAENINGQTPLHTLSESDSIKDGSDILSLVLLLLEHGAAVNNPDANNETPLHLAIERNRFKLAEILLEHGADADAENIDGEAPFHRLSESNIDDRGDILNLVLLLLKHGAAANSRDEYNNTPLHLAIRRNRFKLAEILLETGADADAENINGQTPSHRLSESDIMNEGDILNLVLPLLRHGAGANSRDKDNNTPLHLAIRRNRFKLAEILLEHGADAKAENREIQTPLHILSESDIKDEGEVLNLALLLLKHGAEVTKRDKDNETPLHLAIRWDWVKLAGILLEHGADSIAENNKGQTPFHILSEGHINDGGDILNLVLLLLKHGAAVNSRTKNRHTPLHLAIRWNRLKLAQILLEHGADAYAQNKNGKTPLRMLSDRWTRSHDDGDFVNHVQSFLAHAVGVNRQDGNKTSLRVGIGEEKYKFTDVFTDLSAGAIAVRQTSRSSPSSQGRERGHALALESGAALNAPNDNQMTSTYLQSNPGPFQIAVLLLYYGKNDNIENNEGRSPIYQEIKGEYYIQGGVRCTAINEILTY